jgi:hypothetical protein
MEGELEVIKLNKLDAENTSQEVLAQRKNTDFSFLYDGTVHFLNIQWISIKFSIRNL